MEAVSEPVGWNVYHMTRDLAGEEYITFREFIPNEEALAPVAEAFADEVEEWVSEGDS
jgi:hypothetical protein